MNPRLSLLSWSQPSLVASVYLMFVLVANSTLHSGWRSSWLFGATRLHCLSRGLRSITFSHILLFDDYGWHFLWGAQVGKRGLLTPMPPVSEG